MQLLLSGVFERFPGLKFVMTETGCAWVPGLLDQLDGFMSKVNDTGAIGEIRFREIRAAADAAERVLRPQLLARRQPARLADAALRSQVVRRSLHVGQRLPPRRGHYPYTREHLRQRFADAAEDELRAILAGNAAALYGFDLDALAPFAAESRPDRRRARRAPHRAPRPPERSTPPALTTPFS